MSLYIILLIMLFSGIVGGGINSILAANKDPVTGSPLQSTWHCILIGIGATLLVPLFLEIAQSKLLDNIHSSWTLQDTTVVKTPPVKLDTVKKIENAKKDSLANSRSKDTGSVIKIQVQTSGSTVTKDNGLKIYLLFLAYCFLAAAAGPRFITNLIDSVLKDKQIDTLKQQKSQITQEKEQVIEEKKQVVAEKDKAIEEKNVIEKTQELQTRENRVLASQEEEKVLQKVFTDPEAKSMVTSSLPPLEIGPITVANDPQKGRFGGKSESNGRVLKAEVKSSGIPDFYNLKLWVESTDPKKPLDKDVVFYLHDSFRPSVHTIHPKDFDKGKAVYDHLLSYGAFTVGVVTDGGQTLLELDLAENSAFPIQFRRR